MKYLLTHLALGALSALIFCRASAQTYTVLKHIGESAGNFPNSKLARGPDGTLYGLTRGVGTDLGGIFKVRPDGSGFEVIKVFTVSEGSYEGGLTISGDTLYGFRSSGGQSDKGVIFKINIDGTGFSVLRSFGGNDGWAPQGRPAIVGNVIYGVTSQGGASYSGTIFKIRTDGTGFMIIKDFAEIGGGIGNPQTGLLLDGNTLYGSAGGGTQGILFKINTNGSNFTTLYSFVGSSGSLYGIPCGLALYGNALFGTASSGGSGYGGVFRLDLSSGQMQILKTFTAAEGKPNPDLDLAGGTLYGSTSGGAYVGVNGGVFRIFTDGTGYSLLRSFTDSEENSVGGIIVSGNMVYGTTYKYTGLVGKVFSLQADGTDYRILKQLGGYDGGNPQSSLVNEGDRLYGTTPNGGLYFGGAVFKIKNDGTDYSLLKSFPQYWNCSAGLALVNNTLYGTTQYGGDWGNGIIFKLNTDGTSFEVLHHFGAASMHPSLFVYTNSDGMNPTAGLTFSGGALYGTTPNGGNSGGGTIFKLNTDGTAFTVLKQFPPIGGFPTYANSDGARPNSSLVTSKGKLYGRTRVGGSSGTGTLYAMNTDGTDFSVLKNFSIYDWDDSNGPDGGLFLLGETLYGTIRRGSGSGVLFKVGSDGSGYAVLRAFTDSDGILLNGSLALAGNTLYGTAADRGNAYGGTLFRLNIDGTGFEVIEHFTYATGSKPLSGVLLSGGAIYGTTSEGGARGAGVIYKIREAEENQIAADRDAFASPAGTSIDPEVDVGYRIVSATNQELRGAVRFPVVAGLDPSRILRATMKLYCFGTQGGTSVGLVRAHQMLAPWNENGPFFNSQHSASFTSATVDGGSPAWISWDVTEVVRVWAADPSANYGIMLIADPTAQTDTVFRFRDRASPNASQRPILELVYKNPSALAGALSVGITPTGAVSAGAQWRVDGGPWFNSGVTATNVAAGNRMVDFKPVSGWIVPVTVTVRVIADHLANGDGNYSPEVPQPNVGDVGFTSPVTGTLPSAEGSEYLNVSTSYHSFQDWNYLYDDPRTVVVSGKTVVFQAGHANGLYNAYNEQNDIKKLDVHAETLIIRSPLRLPQTEVIIHARELLFEGSTAKIDTTPRSLLIPADYLLDGSDGLPAGNVTVHAERFSSNPQNITRFVMNGGNGQPGGPGEDGVDGQSRPAVRNMPSALQHPDFDDSLFSPQATAAHVYKREFESVLTGTVLLRTANYYFPYPAGSSAEDSFLYANPAVWQPTSGQDAFPGGRPGNGGSGGTIFESIRLVDYATSGGGTSAAPTFNSGGKPGTPQPAYQQTDNYDSTYNGLFPFGYYSQSHAVYVENSFVTIPGENASSQTADFHVGPAGGFVATGHSLSWISPYTLRRVLNNAQDSFLYGYGNIADGILAEYETLLSRYQTIPEWQQLDPGWQADFVKYLQEIQTLRQRIASHTFTMGGSVTLAAPSSGNSPLSYQWLRNGALLAGATNASLTLSNLSFANQGNYQLVVSNPSGSTTSSVAALLIGRENGVDVSHFQGASGVSSTRWNQTYAQGARFAFVKATEGLTGPDDLSMANNLTRARAAGLLTGVYHVAHPESRPTPGGAVQEADHFLAYSGNAVGPGYLRPVLCMQDGANVLSTADLTDWIIAFSDRIISERGAGAVPVLFMDRTFANNEVDSRLAGYDLWLEYPTNVNAAVVNPSPTATVPNPTGVFNNWAFWQHAHSGRIGGISPVDLNVCHSEHKPLTSYLIPTPITILRQPLSQTVPLGSNVFFSVYAIGNPSPTYQWQFDGSPINGATSSALLLTAITPSEAGNYQAVLTSSSSSITSDVAVLTASTTLPHPIVISTVVDGSMHLSFQGVIGVTYVLQTAASLDGSSGWINLITNVAGFDGQVTFVDPFPTTFPARFYRTVTP